MDKLTKYREIIKTIVNQHAQYKPSHGQIDTFAICDLTTDNYLLMDVGWDNTGRVHAVAFHLRIHEDKIWIEWDGTENGITQELLALGVAQEDIVLGFYSPDHRKLVTF